MSQDFKKLTPLMLYLIGGLNRRLIEVGQPIELPFACDTREIQESIIFEFSSLLLLQVDMAGIRGSVHREQYQPSWSNESIKLFQPNGLKFSVKMGKHRDTVDKVKTVICQRRRRMCWRQFPFDTIDVGLAPLYQFLVDIYPGKLFPVFFCKKIADYPGTAATKIQYIVKRRPLTADTLNAVSYIVFSLLPTLRNVF